MQVGFLFVMDPEGLIETVPWTPQEATDHLVGGASTSLEFGPGGRF